MKTYNWFQRLVLKALLHSAVTFTLQVKKMRLRKVEGRCRESRNKGIAWGLGGETHSSLSLAMKERHIQTLAAFLQTPTQRHGKVLKCWFGFQCAFHVAALWLSISFCKAAVLPGTAMGSALLVEE